MRIHILFFSFRIIITSNEFQGSNLLWKKDITDSVSELDTKICELEGSTKKCYMEFLYIVLNFLNMFKRNILISKIEKLYAIELYCDFMKLLSSPLVFNKKQRLGLENIVIIIRNAEFMIEIFTELIDKLESASEYLNFCQDKIKQNSKKVLENLKMTKLFLTGQTEQQNTCDFFLNAINACEALSYIEIAKKSIELIASGNHTSSSSNDDTEEMLNVYNEIKKRLESHIEKRLKNDSDIYRSIIQMHSEIIHVEKLSFLNSLFTEKPEEKNKKVPLEIKLEGNKVLLESRNVKTFEESFELLKKLYQVSAEACKSCRDQLLRNVKDPSADQKPIVTLENQYSIALNSHFAFIQLTKVLLKVLKPMETELTFININDDANITDGCFKYYGNNHETNPDEENSISTDYMSEDYEDDEFRITDDIDYEGQNSVNQDHMSEDRLSEVNMSEEYESYTYEDDEDNYSDERKNREIIEKIKSIVDIDQSLNYDYLNFFFVK
ncbi:hypothetical protein EDEG_03918 [Edhazardia aedis USNM 41457]|uniref:Uncharacterized protein n=1 Tax=Edhazardia aedis (strain USNM 41457) TaxID=1003232 RepID=J9D0V7_EDHAE|nr:hypothetical protein EDEG_03918 [Edhazardia aedis USNM 41457]|eukprot:EJW01501.1 hypothetical protein EDEG_03918 [Edhazardia aedis USNM 41457]